MRKERKHYTAEEKVTVLRRHLLDKVAVSDLCEELVQSGREWLLSYLDARDDAMNKFVHGLHLVESVHGLTCSFGKN